MLCLGAPRLSDMRQPPNTALAQELQALRSEIHDERRRSGNLAERMRGRLRALDAEVEETRGPRTRGSGTVDLVTGPTQSQQQRGSPPPPATGASSATSAAGADSCRSARRRSPVLQQSHSETLLPAGGDRSPSRGSVSVLNGRSRGATDSLGQSLTQTPDSARVRRRSQALHQSRSESLLPPGCSPEKEGGSLDGSLRACSRGGAGGAPVKSNGRKSRRSSSLRPTEVSPGATAGNNASNIVGQTGRRLRGWRSQAPAAGTSVCTSEFAEEPVPPSREAATHAVATETSANEWACTLREEVRALSRQSMELWTLAAQREGTLRAALEASEAERQRAEARVSTSPWPSSWLSTGGSRSVPSGSEQEEQFLAACERMAFQDPLVSRLEAQVSAMEARMRLQDCELQALRLHCQQQENQWLQQWALPHSEEAEASAAAAGVRAG